MLPNEVKNAIPRQKVRHEIHGTIGQVLCYDGGDIKVLEEGGGYESWDAACCQPVPEEPRQFRVNDKVIIEGQYGDAYTTVETLCVVNGKVCSLYTYGDKNEISLERVRHATPQECKEYFTQV